jgi:hypothetical protein
MAKPYKRAAPICLALTGLAVIGAALGILRSNPLVVIAFLVPTVIYEVYRTEGESTKWASWVLLLVLVAEIFLIVADININVAEFLGSTEETVAGYAVPLGDIKIVAPAIMAILAVILFTRTRGRYTRWLAAIIFLGAFAVVYVLDPTIFSTLLRFGIEEGLDRVR